MDFNPDFLEQSFLRQTDMETKKTGVKTNLSDVVRYIVA